MIKRLLPLFAFLALAVLLAAGVLRNSGKDTSAIPSPLIGKPAPAFSLPVLGEPSRTVGNADLLGQPYLLNVWGSWCPACRDEHPVITGEEGLAALDWGIYGAPETFLVDAQGVVRWKFVGPITPEVVRDQLMPELEKLK